ncbi:MAG: putative major capsid protein [Prokaryotic dsDNA virus sp.]|nr:MAG: putative major capsid protein [Prokaryotic dsDNA virus sp.]|tara:strand:- start:13338 stop:14330 length:993 start_codon:yes stop_codon:yes gene_type:complete
MATGLPTDMKYQDPFFYSGYSDVIQQAVEKFNGGSNGTITLTTNRKPGDYDYESFFANAGGLVSRQDQTSISAATAIKMTQAELIDVKINRKIGPVEWTRSSFKKAGLSEDAIRVAAGEQAAKDVLADMLNNTIRAGRAALDNNAGSTYTVDSNGTMDTASLVSGLALMGDQSSRVSAWVMHSKAFFDLVQYQIDPTNNGDITANTGVVSGMPGSLNRPIIVTDSDALVVTTGTGTAAVTDYYTLGLTPNGLMVEDTEEEFVTLDLVTGLEQLVIRMQGEFAYNLGVKGFQWDVSNGGKNPTDAAVGTGSNWDKAYNDDKSLAGIVIQSR